MKHRVMITIAICIAAAASLAAVYQSSMGYGRQIAVTTEPQSFSITDHSADAYAKQVSVYNAGASTVLCAINCTPSMFKAAVSNGVAVPVPGGMVFTFSGERINIVFMATTNGTSTAYLGAY